MYLALLNGAQKEQFLSLAYALAKADGKFGEEERIALNSYALEMSVPVELDKLNTDTSAVLSAVAHTCGEREKKIIIFELTGLAMVDSIFEENERAFIDRAVNIIGLNSEFVGLCENQLKAYLHFQEELNSLVLS